MNEQFVAIRINKSLVSSSIFDQNEFIAKAAGVRHFVRNGVRYHVVVVGKGSLSDERIKRILVGFESNVFKHHPDWKPA